MPVWCQRYTKLMDAEAALKEQKCYCITVIKRKKTGKITKNSHDSNKCDKEEMDYSSPNSVFCRKFQFLTCATRNKADREMLMNGST